MLPTFGSARFSGALGSTTSSSTSTWCPSRREGLAEIGPHVEVLATYEGLDAHAESIRLRRGTAAP